MTDSPYEEGCVFCLSNEKVTVIRMSESGNTFFAQVVLFDSGAPKLANGAYFVIPVGHYLPGDDMPFDFMREVNEHIRESGMTFDNEGVNRTPEGGGKLPHYHYWLMQVQSGDKPLGLYSLRNEHQTAQRELERARRGRGGW